MIFKQNIIKIGNSFGITIPAAYAESLRLHEKEEVNVVISKIQESIIQYRCRLCSHTFDTDDVNPFCPACFSTDLIEITENLE
jgi:antitoxin component of MazEF toxin-antitoxin module